LPRHPHHSYGTHITAVMLRKKMQAHREPLRLLCARSIFSLPTSTARCWCLSGAQRSCIHTRNHTGSFLRAVSRMIHQLARGRRASKTPNGCRAEVCMHGAWKGSTPKLLIAISPCRCALAQTSKASTNFAMMKNNPSRFGGGHGKPLSFQVCLRLHLEPELEAREQPLSFVIGPAVINTH